MPPPPPGAKKKDRFTTAFRRNPPPFTLTILLLVGVFIGGVLLIKPDPVPEVTAGTVVFTVENDLLRLDAGDEGIDNAIGRILLEPLSLNSTARYFQELTDEGLVSGDWLWFKAMTELEAGQLADARRTVSGAKSIDSPFAACLMCILEDAPVSRKNREDLLAVTESQDYTWWTSRLFHRLDLAKQVPVWEARLKERGEVIKRNRIRASWFTVALVLASLAGLPVLWKLMRRGVPGAFLPPAPGLPPLFKAVAGAWVVAEALRLLAGWVAVPFLLERLHELTKTSSGNVAAQLSSGWYAISCFGTSLLPAWLTGRLCYGRWRLAMIYAGARLRDFFKWRVPLAGAGCFLPVFLINWASSKGVETIGIPYSYLDVYRNFWPGMDWYDLALDFTLACIFAPIAEELVYRGFLLETLKRHTGFWPSAMVSSTLFAALHYSSLNGFFTTFLFGLVMACVMHRTGKLSICIVAHSLYNLDWTLWMCAQLSS